MKKRAMASETCPKPGKAEWKPELNEKVLVRTKLISDAVKVKILKLLYPFYRPYRISKVLSRSAYELK